MWPSISECTSNAAYPAIPARAALDESMSSGADSRRLAEEKHAARDKSEAIKALDKMVEAYDNIKRAEVQPEGACGVCLVGLRNSSPRCTELYPIPTEMRDIDNIGMSMNLETLNQLLLSNDEKTMHKAIFPKHGRSLMSWQGMEMSSWKVRVVIGWMTQLVPTLY